MLLPQRCVNRFLKRICARAAKFNPSLLRIQPKQPHPPEPRVTDQKKRSFLFFSRGVGLRMSDPLRIIAPMNTNIRARKPKKPSLRQVQQSALCALFLTAPVLLGACLALQKSAPFKFRLTLLKFVEDKKIPPAQFSSGTFPFPTILAIDHSITHENPSHRPLRKSIFLQTHSLFPPSSSLPNKISS